MSSWLRTAARADETQGTGAPQSLLVGLLASAAPTALLLASTPLDTCSTISLGSIGGFHIHCPPSTTTVSPVTNDAAAASSTQTTCSDMFRRSVLQYVKREGGAGLPASEQRKVAM